MARAADNSGSSILVDEYFDREDPRFLSELRKLRSAAKLAPLAERWKRDPRPWCRQQVIEYLELPMNCPGHQVLVKRLFKNAEAKGDPELMAAFLVAFDRLVRRIRRRHWRWDPVSRSAEEHEVLVSLRDAIPSPGKRNGLNPKTLAKVEYQPRVSERMRLFSYATRYYLRRRAWRYFRRMGFQKPAEYVAAIAKSLRCYGDSDFATGENILDNWGLVHALYADSDMLAFKVSKVELTEGRSLAELKAAPAFGDLWKLPTALDELLSLVRSARSRLVRVWAMDLLRREHKAGLGQTEITLVLELLDTADDEVQQFATELLQQAQGLDRLPLATWLELLETRNPAAIALICDLFRQHVTPDRLGFSQCIDLACKAASPVCRLGLGFLKTRPVVSAEDRKSLVRLASAQCAAMGSEAAELALGHLGAGEHYDAENVVEFFDSLSPSVRRGAWAWLTDRSAGWSDPVLWCKLLETPFDDVRMKLVETLRGRARLPGAKGQDLTGLWCSVLLAVHRGGRQKLDVVRQVARAIADDPAANGKLLHVLAVAARSIRGPERRAGLSAIVQVLASRPDLAAATAEVLPELKILPQEAMG